MRVRLRSRTCSQGPVGHMLQVFMEDYVVDNASFVMKFSESDGLWKF
jgi:hypothetical protein